MGFFTQKKVDGESGDITTPGAQNGKTAISRFGRTRKPVDAPSSRSSTAPQRLLKAMRLLQLLLAILILGLVAYAVNVFSATFLQSAHIPALVAAILTVLATISLAFLPRLPGLFAHPLSAGLVDLFFALFWLAIMAELAAYSGVAAPRDYTYYTGGLGQQTDGNAAYAIYSGAINRLKTAWACGAAAAAFSGLEFVLFLISALLPLRGWLVGSVTGTDSAGVPTNYHGSATYNGNEPPFEMQTRDAGRTGPTSPASAATVQGLDSTDGQVLDGNHTHRIGTVNGNTFVPTPPGQHKSVLGVEDRGNMI
ncbi:hypothetical protein QM012_007712 [Aureobasidium pullulans]|uniref:MARVEL domain-containing protein n=1 Tax=Aureobasidium pullulans TaxID=5580 RepID=A0ABR0TKF2_AURPU